MSGSTGNDLDLSEIDSQDVEQLANKIEDFYKQDGSVKSQLARAWERNHLFLDGKQWLVYDSGAQTGGLWKKLQVNRENEYIPRPVTNYVFDAYQTLKSYLIKNKPRSSVRPNTQTYRDKSAAKIADLCLEANWERLKEQYNYEYAAGNLVLYGTCFKKDYWDTTALMMAKVPRMEQVPKTDPQTGQQTGMEERQAIDPQTGDALFDEIPLGDVNTAIIEPYRITLDPLAPDLHNCRWVMESSIQTLSWIKAMFDKDQAQNPGYTGLAKEVEEEKQLSGAMRRFYELKNSSGTKNSNAPDGRGGSNEMIPNAAVVKEVYEAPSMKYPKGRMIVVANGKTLYAGDSPYEGPELGDWHPYSECRWEILPGRFWGKNPIDDACEINKQINSIDSVMILVRKTHAIPQKLIPKGCGVDPGQWTGRPGQEVYYRDMGNGVKPETIVPVGVDAQIFKEREIRASDFKAITGAIDILKGDRPPGVTAASALNLLYEVGTGKLFPVLDRWKHFVESSQKKQLKLIAKKYKEPRPQFIQLLKAKNSELSEQAINQFLGTDLYDNCNVIVEAGSNVPKLQAAKQAMLQEIAQTGALHLENPANAMEFRDQLGIAGFDTDIGPDMKRAEWENDLLENIQQSPDNQPVVLDCDNHDIHISVVETRMKEPSFISLPSEVQQAFEKHRQEHQQMQQQAQKAQMMQQQAMGPHAPPPGGGGAPGAAQPASPKPPGPGKGKSAGPSKEVKNAIAGDALTPASLGQGSRLGG